MKRALMLSILIAGLVTLLAALCESGMDIFPANEKGFFIGHLAVLFVITFVVAWLVLQFILFRNTQLLLSELRAMRGKPADSASLDPFLELKNELNAFAKERKEEAERLKKLETYRKEFLGNVSHELKTPIFNIQGYILTLLDGGLEDPRINKEYLQRAEKSVDRMIAIVEDLQAITQFESGELVLEQEKFDVVALAQDVIGAQELVSRSRGVTLELLNDPSRPVFAMGDRFRIRQALVNLVVNSVKYGKENGNTQIRISDLGEKVRVEVSDNGIGIPKQHLSRIFERFYRVDKSRSREMGGTGLGLSIVKHIIEAHGQTIEVMSTEGAGSVFSFTLKKAL
ncbi:MAG TPA: ATP-binding protein [Bacteroidia bacterium]|jgi:two-component system phosphate regulon sensor histidine kinase PhoR